MHTIARAAWCACCHMQSGMPAASPASIILLQRRNHVASH
jgi:hypothetical protein